MDGEIREMLSANPDLAIKEIARLGRERNALAATGADLFEENSRLRLIDHPAPNGDAVPADARLMTDDEKALYLAPDITESERARRLCSIIEGRIKAGMKAANWETVREFRALLKEARRKQRAIVKGKPATV